VVVAVEVVVEVVELEVKVEVEVDVEVEVEVAVGVAVGEARVRASLARRLEARSSRGKREVSRRKGFNLRTRGIHARRLRNSLHAVFTRISRAVYIRQNPYIYGIYWNCDSS